MRVLETTDLRFVSGAGTVIIGFDPESGFPIYGDDGKKAHGNNGFGNGSDDPNLAAPGNSGTTPGDKDFSSVR